MNTYNFADRSLSSVEAVSYHEGNPGHHLQTSIAQELTGLPEFRKQESFTAYTEGWGLYSERLGKDIGFYQDPYNDYGQLEADIWRAIRRSSTPVSTTSTGPASRWWTSSTTTPPSMRRAFKQRQTGTSRGRDEALGVGKMGQLKLPNFVRRQQTALGPKFDL